MNKEDYLRKKGKLPKVNIGTIYTFHSNRIDGVKEIQEHQIWTQRVSGHDICYNIKDAPYECRITEDDTIGEDVGCGSGIGDLWSWTNFCSLDIKELEQAREKEIKRVFLKYGKKDDVELQLEHITIAQYIVRNDMLLGIDTYKGRVWTNDLNIATLYKEEMTLEKAIEILGKLDMEIDNIELLPVKKITQYQLGEF